MQLGCRGISRELRKGPMDVGHSRRCGGKGGAGSWPVWLRVNASMRAGATKAEKIKMATVM